MTATTQDQRWNRLSITILVAGVCALLGAGILFVLAFTGAVGEDSYSGPETIVGFQIEPTPQPTPTVLPTPSDAPIARLVIPRFEVDAPVAVKGVDANRVMQDPEGPEQVAWYDFSGKPGYLDAPRNAVFSGHVDYINYGPAVFYNIGQLVAGDRVEVVLQDGTVYAYSVTTLYSVSADPTEEELRSIVGETPAETVTLITCGGSWNGHEYDSRTIVRAERLYQPVTAETAP